MGLKLKKMRSVVQEQHEVFASDLNNKLGTSFQFNYNPEIVPEGADEWGRSDDEIVQSFKNTFFIPLEKKLSELFEDPMYKDEISKQIKTISFMPKDAGYLETSFSDGNLTLTINVAVRQIKFDDEWSQTAMDTIGKTIDSQLS